MEADRGGKGMIGDEGEIEIGGMIFEADTKKDTRIRVCAEACAVE